MPTTKYVWDIASENVFVETNAAGAIVVEYTNEPNSFGGLVSSFRGSASAYHHYDMHSTRDITNDSENVTDTYAYSAFGMTIASSGSSINAFRYAGEAGYYFDAEVDDYYVRSRTYSPSTSRWSSQDPLGFVDGSNFYTYVGNNPVGYIDPSGQIKVFLRKLREWGRQKCPKRLGSIKPTISWIYELDKPAPCDGWLIQEIQNYRAFSLCSGCDEEMINANCPDCDRALSILQLVTNSALDIQSISTLAPLLALKLKKDTHYFEAFRVSEKQVLMDASLGIGKFIKQGKKFDGFAAPITGENCGYDIGVAKLKFFCDKAVGNLYDQPKVWVGTGLYQGAPGERYDPLKYDPKLNKGKPKHWDQPPLRQPPYDKNPVEVEKGFHWSFVCWRCCGKNRFVKSVGHPMKKKT